MVIRERLKISSRKGCWFESSQGHQLDEQMASEKRIPELREWKEAAQDAAERLSKSLVVTSIASEKVIGKNSLDGDFLERGDHLNDKFLAD